MGSTPLYKSSLHKDRLSRVTLDGENVKELVFVNKSVPGIVLK